jgi:hypothetical protein
MAGRQKPGDLFQPPLHLETATYAVGLNPPARREALGVSVTKIRVKVGPAEAEVEADPEHLKEAIELIPAVLAKLPTASALRTADASPEPDLPRAAGPVQNSLAQLPSVTLEKTDSLADVIGKFFADPWGRERRKLSDVREALQSYGLNYPKQSVAVALLRLAKTARIRRFKAEDGEFVYTSATPGPFTAVQPRGDVPAAELSETEQS